LCRTICSINCKWCSKLLWNTGATGSSITVSPSITTAYSVVGTTLACSSASINLTVTVNPKPVITVTSDTICNGQTATLTASGASTYVWNTGATGASISVTPTVNTTYTVTGTTLNCPSLPKNGIVIVNAIPTLTVNSPIICNGQTATLTASGATTYIWNNGATSPSITVSPSVTTNYSVVGTKAGCPSLPKNTSITVNPIPIVTVNSPTICSGRSATLTASGATTYSWSNGATSSVITVSPNTTANYTVTGTTLNCPSLPKTSTVTVNPTPVISVNSTIICEGESTLLTASGADTYSWSNGLSGSSINVSPILTTTYTVTGTSLSCPSIPKNSVVTVSPLLVPAVTITPNKNDICFGTPIIFTATVNGTGITPTYQWFVNSIPSGNNSSQFTSSALNNGDNVQLEITTTFRCSQPKTVRSNVVKAIVSKVLYNKIPLSYCKNDSAIIDTSILNIHPTPDPKFSIIWKNGNNITTDSVINYSVINLASGNIPFTIKFGNNCTVNDVMNINVKPLPAINAVVNIPRAKYEQEVQLNVLTNQTLSYLWSPTSLVNIDSVKNPTSVIKSSVQFTVIVQDFYTKCINKDTVFVELINECTKDFIYVPTGFSPNNDGINDCFSILSPPKLSDFRMIIYDRWNEKVFETNSEKECWNGTFNGVIAATDTYSYIISFKCYNGTVLAKKGTISIIR
jgi:gliding motility-associated-like protein